MMEFNEISAKDEFVDSWSDSTKGKVASAYLTILRKVGMLTNENRLHSLACNNYLLVETTGFGGHVVAEQGEGAGPASPGIVQAGLSGPQAAVSRIHSRL